MREEINSMKVLLTNALTNSNFLSMSEVPTLPVEVSLPLQNTDDLKKVEKMLASDKKVVKAMIRVIANVNRLLFVIKYHIRLGKGVGSTFK